MGSHGVRQKATSRGRPYTIFDRGGLAALLLETIKARFGGSQNAAARSVALSRTVLDRLCSGTAASARHQTVESLRRLLRRDQYAKLNAVLLSPETRERLRDFDQWIYAASQCEACGPLRALARTEFETASELDDMSDLMDPRSQYGAGSPVTLADDRWRYALKLIRELRRDFVDVWRPLDRRLETRRHLNPRATLAFLRVVSPLLGWLDTGGIERAPAEMTDMELRRFLRAGIQRECILLDRESDVRRAHTQPRHRESTR